MWSFIFLIKIQTAIILLNLQKHQESSSGDANRLLRHGGLECGQSSNVLRYNNSYFHLRHN